jgi:transposase-like protein
MHKSTRKWAVEREVGMGRRTDPDGASDGFNSVAGDSGGGGARLERGGGARQGAGALQDAALCSGLETESAPVADGEGPENRAGAVENGVEPPDAAPCSAFENAGGAPAAHFEEKSGALPERSAGPQPPASGWNDPLGEPALLDVANAGAELAQSRRSLNALLGDYAADCKQFDVERRQASAELADLADPVPQTGGLTPLMERLSAARAKSEQERAARLQPPPPLEGDIEVEPEEVEELEGRLPLAQVKAIGLILLGESHAAVARAVGVSRSTVFRWRRQRAFSTVLRFRQEVVYSQAADRLRAALVRAMSEITADLVSAHKHVRRTTALRLLPYVGSTKLRPVEPPRRARALRRLEETPPTGAGG